MSSSPAAIVDDLDTNPSSNPHLNHVLQARLSRRALLRGAAGSAGGALFGAVLAGGGSLATAATPRRAGEPAWAPRRPARLGFNPVAKSLADALTVPAGYTATVLYRLGDPIGNLPDYRNDGTDPAASFEARAGDHHDGMHFFSLGRGREDRDERRDDRGRDDRGDRRGRDDRDDRGLLAINHESITPAYLHPAGQSFAPAGAQTDATVRPLADEVLKEIAAHGVSIVEVQRAGRGWRYRRQSKYNRRITAATPMRLAGPAARTPYMVTRYSPDGSRTRGTVNNCASGYTPWGTYLTCEENWAGYFRRLASVDNPHRSAREIASLDRYGVGGSGAAGRGRHLWATVTPDTADDQFGRWNAMKLGASADGRDDYRNAPNTFGWVVEIDPFEAGSTPKKRTALGRFAHEGAWPAKPVAGQPIVYYMGCDSRNEYIYKYVSNAAWDPADADGGMAAGDKYLDDGRLYVARFDADGSGQWIELALGRNGIGAGNAAYAFADAADVLVNARLAADAAGGTRMDRPEWGAVDPVTGAVYMTLTNNSQRTVANTDAANPRAYTDVRGGSAVQSGNVNGHIIRWQEPTPASTGFRWDVYLFGAEADAPAGVNLSGLTAANDLSSPDGLWFSDATGVLWIQTDDGAYTDVTNCMMLAALPGRVGDGGAVVVPNAVGAASGSQPTFVGRRPADTELRRFLVGPRECEITGLAETPDGRALFVNIQHPGEDTPPDFANPGSFGSHWPDGGAARPRSATVVIIRDDGGPIGL